MFVLACALRTARPRRDHRLHARDDCHGHEPRSPRRADRRQALHRRRAGQSHDPLVVPILAALGLTVPKTSSRAITSPAGTADTMATLAEVALSPARLAR